MRKLKATVSILGIFAGLGGATHGPGEMLQGNTVPSTLIIEAWPELTALAGEPAMTIIPSFMITGVLTILVGGGLVPPLFGIAAGIIAALFHRTVIGVGKA